MLTRRSFLASAAVATRGLTALGSPHTAPGSPDDPRTRPPKRVAVVASVYWYLSHAYHIAGRFLDGYMVGDAHHFPEFGVASCFVEQPTRDLSRDLAKEHG